MSHLVLIGAGHAHLTLLQRLDRFLQQGHQVTVISPDPFHDYSGMGPGLLGGRYLTEQARFDIRRMSLSGGATFVEDRLVSVQADVQRLVLASGQTLAYDYASFNVGSEVVVPPGVETDEKLVPVKPIANLAAARRRLLDLPSDRPLRLVVVGGGPAGTEVAGNLQRLLARAHRSVEILQVSGHRLLEDFPARMRTKVLEQYIRRKITVREGTRLTAYRAGRVWLDDGSVLEADGVFLATGVRPPDLFRVSGLSVGPDGGLLVNRKLQSVDSQRIFAGGDCITFQERPLAKVGVYAVRQNPVLLENLQAAMSGRPLRSFSPQRHYLLVLNLGDDRGVLHWRGCVLSGAWAFGLKDRIDRRFMSRFQA